MLRVRNFLWLTLAQKLLHGITIQTQDRYTEAALRRKIEIETSDEAHVCKECEPKLCNQMWKLWKRQNEAKNTDFSLSP